MQVFVELERARVDLAARKEVDRAFLILNLDVLVVADEKPLLCKLEYVLDVADGTDQLAGRKVFVICLTSDRGSLDIL